MIIDTENIFSMTQANQNFSSVAKNVEKTGKAVIFKNNKPKYLIVDLENNNTYWELSDDEKIEIVARRILEKYLPAFKELAK